MNESKEFQERNSKIKRSRWKKIECLNCRNIFEVRPGWLWRKYCSQKCAHSDFKLSEEGKRRMVIVGHKSGVTRKERGSQKGVNHPMFGKKNPVAALKIIETMQSGKMKRVFNTKPEIEMKKILDELNEYNKPQKRIHSFMFDFFIPRTHMLIEIDGGYWHNLPKTIERDKQKQEYCEANGYSLFRFSDKNLMEQREKVKSIMVSAL